MAKPNSNTRPANGPQSVVSVVTEPKAADEQTQQQTPEAPAENAQSTAAPEEPVVAPKSMTDAEVLMDLGAQCASLELEPEDAWTFLELLTRPEGATEEQFSAAVKYIQESAEREIARKMPTQPPAKSKHKPYIVLSRILCDGREYNRGEVILCDDKIAAELLAANAIEPDKKDQ